MKRISKTITNKEDLDFILGIDEKSGVLRSTIMELFGEFDGKSRFRPYDIITVPPGSYGPDGHKNKNSFRTTVGIWIFNRVFIEPQLFHLFKYVNKTITKKQLNQLMKEIGYAVLEERCTLEAYKDFVLKGQKFMPFVTVMSSGYTMKMLTITKKIDEEKARLIKKYRKQLDAKDPHAVIAIQEELMNLAKKILKDDPSMDSYESGARGSFGNHFKNMFIMKGLTKNPDPTKGYNIIMSSYMEGISKEEYADFANSLAEGPYSRGIRTATGGYWEKLALPAYQHISLGKVKDCKTKRTLKIVLDKNNIDDYLYSYVVQGKNLVEITTQNKKEFLNKEVQLRFSSLCEAEGCICDTCAGNAFKRLDVKNIGATIPQIPAKLKLISMKAFHDSQVVMTKMDPKKAFGF